MTEFFAKPEHQSYRGVLNAGRHAIHMYKGTDTDAHTHMCQAHTHSYTHITYTTYTYTHTSTHTQASSVRCWTATAIGPHLSHS